MSAIFVREFQMVGGAEEAARFVHHACCPAAVGEEAIGEDLFYARVIEHALGYFGSRLLYPARSAVRGFDLGDLSAQAGAAAADDQFTSATEELGYVLGSQLYDAYVAGCLSKRYIRSLFFRRLSGSTARSTYLQIIKKARSSQRRALT
jgi:hypothetical protein